ncbi:hypothetical protein [Leptospira sarikeiensis]|nr:hypothetical protein [Leptospira sarikeiensis]
MIQNEELVVWTTSLSSIIPNLGPYLSKYCQRDPKNIPLACIENEFQNDLMVWDIGFQDKIVYLVVGSAAIYLAFPLLSSFKTIFGKTQIKETRFGCYEDACSSCVVIVKESPKVLSKRKHG